MKKKILFISSNGGHFAQLMELVEPLKEKYKYKLVIEYLPCHENLKKNIMLVF
ncbi:hypothetical protein SAMN02745227_01095 [Anaerobranca californiensis DSM 14826]|jgi:hypothetical protein|uniref:Oligosaccharide biosynthesis protein Alg14 like n=1 Tax=Anaerobranca californiensis DSM 14826 TaxID=1120989 RepID=A0A1M6NAV7_9FIRM|nr:hypothetical protein [Anaerobranca californiensis]SHJ92849.1 hypothetical protein SAMN02745227_01095 [Anaerobranca californiensis DSM 14826]